jgi:hypothetical protein
MLLNRRGHRAVLIAAALLIASLGVAPASDAASSKRCRALAGKARVVAKGKDSLVVSRGNATNFTLTYSACLYVKPRLFKIPGQNGGDTEHFGRFTLGGRYLAYEHVNAEEAAGYNPSWSTSSGASGSSSTTRSRSGPWTRSRPA